MAMAGLNRRVLPSLPAIDFASSKVTGLGDGLMNLCWIVVNFGKVKAKGISFGKLVCLSHCAGARVEAFRTNQSTIDDFRNLFLFG